MTDVTYHRPQICKDLFINCTANGTRDINISNEFCILFALHNNCTRPTTYQQQDAVHLQPPTIILVVFILITVSSFLTNGFMCVVYSLSKEIRTAKHYFMVNLFISNDLIAVFGIPFYLTEYIKHHSKTLCQIGSVVDVLCCTSSIISLTSISTERFVAVKYPLRYRTILSRKRCLAVLCFVWVYSVACSFAFRIPVGNFDMKHCIFFTDSCIIVTTFASFLLPLFAMFVTYGWIYKIVKCDAPPATNRMKREFKAAKISILITGAFVGSWLPFFCYIWVLRVYKVQIPFTHLHYIIQVVRYINGLVSPFLYLKNNRAFRYSMFKLLKRIFLPKERHPCSETNNEFVQTIETVL